MKYNPYGELRAHFGADAEWNDIITGTTFPVLESDLDAAKAAAPSDPTTVEQALTCLLCQTTKRVFGATKVMMFPHILYWESTVPGKVHRGEIESGLNGSLTEAFDLIVQGGDDTLLRAMLPMEIVVKPPSGKRSLATRRAWSRTHRENVKSGTVRADTRKTPVKKVAKKATKGKMLQSPMMTGIRFRRDGFVLVKPTV